ncbi:polyketide cyclase [Cohnella sp. CIP 111063]|uniref:SRPBCC family protein n=1 Tax=unclassified Cohnella TaxID=2636738 RepID=UPI000B8C3D2E|nr:MULTISPECIES: SRPBCC family protein [unclassified Cohnella]OXS52904.1 polyketide cyclase [Cohnella sp. CIP 111063]PRX60156.1 uncharacterized protein YndB with AHSA1/START domain [Cohnella sp. SGD-V74]
MTAGENEIAASRVFNVPLEQTFRAWTTPELLARWWGPHGFTNTFHQCDIRPGGEWQYTMHGPDGTDYPNRNVFVEIVPQERIVLDHLTGHEFRVTATFEDVGGRTRVVFRQQFKLAEEYEQAKAYCVEGNEQNLDRLGALLEEMPG